MKELKEKLPNNLTVFFGKEGLSMSEANHISDMIKEKNKSVYAEIEQAGVVKETLLFEGEQLITDPKKVNLKEKCLEEGELYAISSWLREAVKSKEQLINFVKNKKEVDLVEFFGLGLPKTPSEQGVLEPKMKEVIPPTEYTEWDIIGEMNIAERAEYYSVEAKSAHIGKKIHNKGKISQLRDEILNFKNFRMVTYNGQNGTRDYAVKRELKYNINEINDIFFYLQKKHREYEQKLNFYKADIKNKLATKNAEEKARYSKEYNEAKNVYENEMKEYNAAYKNFSNSYNSIVNEANEMQVNTINEISKWKIVVPNVFKEKIDSLLKDIASTASE
jgi:hypothetical protein